MCEISVNYVFILAWNQSFTFVCYTKYDTRTYSICYMARFTVYPFHVWRWYCPRSFLWTYSSLFYKSAWRCHLQL